MSRSRVYRTARTWGEPAQLSATQPAAPRSARFLRRTRLGFSARSLPLRLLSGAIGVAVVGGGAYAATNWVVGLGAGSSGEGQSATVSNLTITAVATPSASNQLFPGGSGDVVATIANPNSFPVTVTGVDLPTSSTYANGYTTSALSTPQTGCTATAPSYVGWNYATGTSGSVHALTSALTVAANGSLAVTFTNDATMTLAAPSACENTYFSLPSLTGVVATGGAAAATTSPATDAWTS